jgi:translocation and assembly module TamB
VTDRKEPELEDPEIPEVLHAPEPSGLSSVRARRRRLPWMMRTSLDMFFSAIVLLLILVVGFFWASSAAFENFMRHRIVAALQNATGGRVEIAGFHWDLLHLAADATGVTIHGLEAANEAPYAHVDRLHAEIGLVGLFTAGISPTVIVHAIEIDQPSFHLIVYPDGSTNQPHPRHPQNPRKPVLDTLFDARIGQLSLRQGSVHIANHVYPLDLRAQDTSVQLSWVPAAGPNPAVTDGSYRITLSLGQLSFAQGPYVAKNESITSRLDATLVLYRNSAQLDSLKLSALGRTLTLSGKLADFAHPSWQAKAEGQIDLRILGPTTGFANTRSGVISLNASATGKGGDFLSTGNLTSDAIHYQDPVVDAQTAGFSARFRADNQQLLVSAIRTRLARGGEVNGEFQYDNWLDSTPKPTVQRELRRDHKTWPIPTGVVRANVAGVSLDTILVMLATPEYRHLALDTHVSGPTTAKWTGLADDLEIGGQLAFASSPTPVPGEAPLNGSTDATYHADSGSVKIHTLDVHLPHSALEGQGSLGVYPASRSSEMDLDLKTTDLSEFDGVLRTLGLKQGSRTGSEALPIALKGQAEFHGQLNSSWLTPRVEGHLTATNIAIQVPASSTTPPVVTTPPKFINWDSVDVDGLYSPASIVIHHGTLKRGPASLTVEGHLDADDPTYTLSSTAPEFDGSSALSLKTNAQQFPLEDLLVLAGVTTPVSGKLNAQLEIQGTLNALNGSGTIDVAKIAAYGESIDHLRATGSITGQQLKITSLTAEQTSAQNSGRLTGSGSYDLAHHHFQIDAHGSAIDLASIQQVKKSGVAITGKLGFTLAGDGTFDDPHLQTHATLSSMAFAGEPVSDLLVSATSLKRAVTYDITSHQPAGDLSAHGQTSLDADYMTQASVQLSKFDVGALLKLLHVTGITGQSDLEGTATLSGPLAHIEKMSGEASLRELAVSVEGVHLQSKGAAHATLANGVAKLDPLEITGEDTDLKLNGTLAITGKQQLDLQASGSVNLRLAETVDPDLIASGVTSFQMEAHGPVLNPILQGKVEFQNAALALQDFPNGLSQIKGTLEFSQNRLEVRSLTAMSGGGQLSVGGYIGFQRGLYADLTATGKSIRIRYPQGVSSLADASLRLQGPQNNLLLSGNVVVTRFAINSDLDMSAFASATGGVQPIVSPDAPSNHIRFDVHLVSAPQLNFQNAFAKLAGDVDLHLRGTLASPSILGRISLTEGSTSIGGTQYELQRGDIYFNNPVRIQPNIDLDATARVEDYDITLGLHGTPDKLKVSYRSEPPLPEADVIALLALGRTSDEQRVYSQQQQQAGDNPMTDALLGGALNATVSNRVQRLFGSGAIKVDPNFIGSIGNSTARVTVVEQIGKNLTFTYASNVNTTTQQLIQAEIAINRHVSLLVTQDESGIFSMVVKARRRYR